MSVIDIDEYRCVRIQKYTYQNNILCKNCVNDLEIDNIRRIISSHYMLHISTSLLDIYCKECNTNLVKVGKVQDCDWCDKEIAELLVDRAFREGFTISVSE